MPISRTSQPAQACSKTICAERVCAWHLLKTFCFSVLEVKGAAAAALVPISGRSHMAMEEE